MLGVCVALGVVLFLAGTGLDLRFGVGLEEFCMAVCAVPAVGAESSQEAGKEIKDLRNKKQEDL